MRSDKNMLWRIAAITAVPIFAPFTVSATPVAEPQAAMERIAQDTMLPDSMIQRSLSYEITMDPAVSSQHVTVDVNAGIVTLSGTVPSLLSSEAAVQNALATRGVRSVVNGLEVTPTLRADSSITRDVRDALLFDPAADSYEIDVAVKAGKVILTGRVDSWAEKTLARDLAAGVRGVVAVTNLITVEHGPRLDAEIKRDIEGLLTSSVMLDDAVIDVTVDDGQVTLSGFIGSAADRDHAIRTAWVSGVETVTSDNLRIRWWAQDPMTRDKMVAPTDMEIRSAILDALALSPRVSAFDPAIDVNDGFVTLSGTVDNLEARRDAESIARNTVGVVSVTNDLVVVPASMMADLALASRVKSALIRDPFLTAHEIVVSADDGIVTLNGEVDSRFAYYRAEAIAARQMSVIDVENDLTIESTWITKSDRELERDVETELFWNPWVRQSEITVTAVDGSVILEGTVDSWFERSEAEQEAYEAGARDVTNHLAIDLLSGPVMR